MKENVKTSDSPNSESPYIKELQILLGERLSLSDAIREHHGHDESFHASSPPEAVVFAESMKKYPRSFVSVLSTKNLLLLSAPGLP